MLHYDIRLYMRKEKHTDNGKILSSFSPQTFKHYTLCNLDEFHSTFSHFRRTYVWND